MGKRGITKRELSQLYYLSREIERDKRRLKELEALAKKLDAQDVFTLQGPEYARPKGHADDSLNQRAMPSRSWS